jgi:methyl-accepting chemotaxis protein
MKWFYNLKIKNKIIAGFSTVLLLFAIISVYQIINLFDLDGLQQDGARRAVDAVTAHEIQIDIVDIYAKIGEAIINRDATQMQNDIKELKKLAKANIAKVNTMIDTDEEIEKAKLFNTLYSEYLEIFENELIPLLNQNESEIKKEILEIDEKIDLIKERILEPIIFIAESIEDESVEADELFDAKSESARNLIIIIVILAIFIGITLSIIIANILSKPIVYISEQAHQLNLVGITSMNSALKSLAEGNLDQRVEFELKPMELDRTDEIGNLSQSMDKVIHGINSMREEYDITRTLIKNLISETDTLVAASSEGNFDSRGDEEKFKGMYKGLVKRLNSLIEAIITPVQEGSRVLEIMSKGDLTARVVGNYSGDHQIIKNSINALGDSNSKLINELKEAVEATASASTQISSSAEEMAAGAQEQSSQTTEVAAAMEEMSRTIVETASNATAASEASKDSATQAKDGTSKVDESKKGMNKIVVSTKATGGIISSLANKTDQIGEIAQVIDDIADQTNLLALNAAIEAARAGEQGRGFAVVADEVRKLAERTTKATKEIAETIKAIQGEAKDANISMQEAGVLVNEGLHLNEEVGTVLTSILDGAENVSSQINQVAAASEEQSATAEQVSANIEAINNVANESAAGVQQIASASEDLNRLTENLGQLVSKFKISENSTSTNIESEKDGRLNNYMLE